MRFSIAAGSCSSFWHSAKSSTVVVPPCSAARVTCSGGPLSMWLVTPGTTIGQPQWTCGSMPPGMTICPLASIVRLAPMAAKPPGAPIATILSPEIARSASAGPDGSTAKPPVTTMSNMDGPSEGGLRMPRGGRQQPEPDGAGEGEPVEDSGARNRLHDEYEPAAPHAVGPALEPEPLLDGVLGALDHRRPLGPVGERDQALDPQQVLAVRQRQAAERFREIEPADRALEHDGVDRDAMAVRGKRLGCRRHDLLRNGKVEQQRRRIVRAGHARAGSGAVEAIELRDQVGANRRQIGLGDQHAIGDRDLACRLGT